MNSACSSTEVDGFDPVPLAQERAGQQALFQSMCPQKVQIARSKFTNGCPSVAGWTKTSVLKNGNDWLAAHPGLAPDPEGHVCRYNWTGAIPIGGALSNIQSHPNILDTAPDCNAVLEQGTSALTPAVEHYLRDMFYDQIGKVDADALLLPSGESSEQYRSPVLVGVIDTMPTSEPSDPRSEHGENMARIATDVACPSGETGCAVTVERTLGMPRYGGGYIDTTNGGFMGTHSDLAAAIMEQVQRWRFQYPATTPLIINLSVGWEPHVFGGNEVVPPPRVAAVRTALEIASCHGALIIASSGNETALCGVGPMLPAAWEQRAAPDVTRCSDLGIPTASPSGLYRPLVHAVGGLDTAEAPMPGSRDGGNPRLAAAATYGVAGGSNLTTGLTGTSVSAAVVSGAAALVWSYAPALTAHEVMDIIYASGEPLNRWADFTLTPALTPLAHELNVCAALEAACQSPNTCPPLGLNCSTGAVSVNPGIAVALADKVPASIIADPVFNPAQECALECGVPVYAASDGQDPCTSTTVPPSAYYTSPQPNSPPCPACTLSGEEVHASLDSYYELQTIDDVVVTLYDGTKYERFDFGPVPLTPTEVTLLRLPHGEIHHDEIVSATIGVQFTGHDWPVDNELLRDVGDPATPE
ncbi:MAG: S8/S53 family peptidase [Deltaproteobacteria bacterium]|nr:S8/S53 family peptidase [Deltaproteobacteria bacterium]